MMRTLELLDEVVSNNPSARHVHLRLSSSQRSDELIPFMAEVLPVSTHLEGVSMGTDFTDHLNEHEAIMIGTNLAMSRSIRTVQASFASVDVLNGLLRSMALSTSLRNLDWRTFGIHAEAWSVALRVMLHQGRLRRLRLAVVHSATDQLERYVYDAISQLFYHNSTLQQVDLFSDNLSLLHAMLQGLTGHPQLEAVGFHTDSRMLDGNMLDELIRDTPHLVALHLTSWVVLPISAAWTKLRHLEFTLCLFTTPAMTALASLLRASPVESLTVDRCLLGDELFAILVAGLRLSTSIRKLYLKSIGLESDAGVKCLSSWLSSTKSLRALALSNWSELDDPRACKLLAEGLEANTSLQDISLRECDGDHLSLEVLSTIWRLNSNVRRLQLGSMVLPHNAFPLLNERLATSSCVEIDLSFTKETNLATTVALAHYLKQPSVPLRILILDGCNLGGAEGANLLFTALEVNDSLETLSLRKISFGPSVLVGLAGSLPSMKRLTSLTIATQIAPHDPSIVQMMEGIRNNNSLVDLKIDGCAWNAKLLLRVEMYLQRNRAQRVLREHKQGKISSALWPQALSSLSVLNRENALYPVLRASLDDILPDSWGNNVRKRSLVVNHSENGHA